MGPIEWIRNGNSTETERDAAYPCDECRPPAGRAYFRAISVKASPGLAYRWLCQLRLAPYSYDLVDNRGRRSPRELTPGADRLSAGDAFMVFRATDVRPGIAISGVSTPAAERVFGQIAATYRVDPAPDGSSRIVVKMWLGGAGRLARLKRALLVAGDAIMMRKQLTTIRDLAERDERRLTGASAPDRTGLPRKAFAVFLGLHASVHLIGFVLPWRLATFRDMTYRTTILGGSIDIGDAGIKFVGLLWLAATILMLLAAILVWRRGRFALAATRAVLVASLALCVTGLPSTVAGLAIDVILLALLAVVPETFADSARGRPDRV